MKDEGWRLLAFCIMDIQSAVHYVKSGYRIRRASWPEQNYIEAQFGYFGQNYLVPDKDYCQYCGWHPSQDDLLADDWEIITKGMVDGFPVTYSH